MKPTKNYFLPAPSRWPLIGSMGLFLLALSVANFVHGNVIAHYLFFAGALLLTYMMFGWFGVVIDESMRGLHSDQMDRTYRWGMAWFIVSEVAFFYSFFGAYCMLGNLRCLYWRKLAPFSTHTLLWRNSKPSGLY